MTLKRWIYIIIIILMILTIFIFINESNHLKIREINLVNNDINTNLHGAKIVHFADTHFNNKTKLKKVNQLVTSINNTEPDVIIFTGDLINNDTDQNKLNEVDQALNKLTKHSLKLAVLGEKDNLDAINILTNNGFNIVNDELIPVYINNELIYLYGYYKGKNIKALTKLDISKYVFVALTHKPENIDKFIDLRPDYILTSHTHNQEINIPFIKLSNTPYPMNNFKKENSSVFITNGTGHSHYPFRFNSNPGFNLYRLLKKN